MADEILAYVTVLVWPVVIALAIVIFRKDISSVLKNVGTIKIGSLVITLREANELLTPVILSIKDLAEDRKQTFVLLVKQPGFEIPAGFVRSNDSKSGEFHEALRDLRDAGLVRPRERTTWREHRHVEITPLGSALFKNKDLRDQTGIKQNWVDLKMNSEDLNDKLNRAAQAPDRASYINAVGMADSY